MIMQMRKTWTFFKTWLKERASTVTFVIAIVATAVFGIAGYFEITTASYQQPVN